MKHFFATDKRNQSLFLLRLVAGGIILPHGLQKTLGLFGGGGYEGTISFFTGMLGIPMAIAILIIVAESIGALGLIFGFFTRLCAFGIGTVMIGAILISHINNGFFMNWAGNLNGEGYEYHLLVFGVMVVLFVWGAGAWSMDAAIAATFTPKAHKPKKAATKRKKK